MTQYKTPIVLGQKYRDDRLGIEGYANQIIFHENGCVEILLEFMKDGKREREWFNELRLGRLHESGDVDVTDDDLDPQIHESDIVLGKEYEDIQTKLRGWAQTIMFSEQVATQVAIRSIGKDKDDLKMLRWHDIDDFLLKSVETQVVAEDKTGGKRSPSTRERLGSRES